MKEQQQQTGNGTNQKLVKTAERNDGKFVHYNIDICCMFCIHRNVCKRKVSMLCTKQALNVEILLYATKPDARSEDERRWWWRG